MTSPVTVQSPTDNPAPSSAVRHRLEEILAQRVVIMDGAMGTTIREYGMTEADIRGDRFRDAATDLLNNGDLFSLTQPQMIYAVSLVILLAIAVLLWLIFGMGVASIFFFILALGLLGGWLAF